MPVTRMRGASAGATPCARRHAGLELVGDLVDHRGEPRHVVVEGDLHGQQRVLAARWAPGRALRVALSRCRARRLSLTSMIAAQVLGGQRAAAHLFELGDQPLDLRAPERAVLRPLHLRQLHDVHGGHLGEQLVRLLLAVAGGLADDQVGDFSVGADLAQLEAHGRLDEGAGVLGQQPLDLAVGPLGAGAEPDAWPAQGADDLLGHVEAERPDDGAAGRLVVRRVP